MKDKLSADSKKESNFSEKGRLRRQNLLSVAKHIVLNDGADKLILRQVAKVANVKLGHLQHYFPTHDDLLEAIIYEAWESDEAILIEATSAKDVNKVVTNLLLSWGGHKAKIYLILALRGIYQDRFIRLKMKIYQSFYDDMVMFLKIIHPSRSNQDLLRQAKIITSLLDGAMLQVDHCAEIAINNKESDFHKDLIKLVSELILA